jgi:hypothetical protein
MPTYPTALYLGQRGDPGAPPRMAREPVAAPVPGDAAPWYPPVPRLPVLAEAVAAFPAADARLVVVGAGDPGMAACRDLRRAELHLAALVTTTAEVRDRLGPELTVLVPDRPDDVWRTAGEFAGRLARRTAAPVIVYCPDGRIPPAGLDLLAEQGVRGVVLGGTGVPPDAALPVFTTAGSPLGAVADLPAGHAIAHSVEAVLRRHLARSVGNARVAVLGYHGRAVGVAAALHGLGARVGVGDPDPLHRCAAVLAGHRAFDRYPALAGADVVVDLGGLLGGTGLSRLGDNAVLVTDTTEVPAPVEVLAVREELALCRRADGTRMYVLLAGRAPGVGRLRDLLCAELYLCIRQLAAAPHPPGLHRLPRSRCADLARRWCRIYQA